MEIYLSIVAGSWSGFHILVYGLVWKLACQKVMQTHVLFLV